MLREPVGVPVPSISAQTCTLPELHVTVSHLTVVVQGPGVHIEVFPKPRFTKSSGCFTKPSNCLDVSLSPAGCSVVQAHQHFQKQAWLSSPGAGVLQKVTWYHSALQDVPVIRTFHEQLASCASKGIHEQAEAQAGLHCFAQEHSQEQPSAT